MHHRSAILLAAAVALAGTALAAENHPDCESGQPNRADGSGIVACEGEHWDGQDPNGVSSSPQGANVNSNGAFVAMNAGPDPATPDPGNGATDVHQLRVSVRTAGAPAVYYYQAAYGVGQQATYVGSDGTVAWYGQDGTNQLEVGGTPIFAPVICALNCATNPDEGGADGNIIAWVVGAEADYAPAEARLAAFKTGESDCSQAEYQASDCARDNTAVTVELMP